MTVERLVVHPAYWRRGHASALINFGNELAKLERVDQGVLASSMGAAVFAHAGYALVAKCHVPGDDKWPEGWDIAVLKLGCRSGKGGVRDWVTSVWRQIVLALSCVRYCQGM